MTHPLVTRLTTELGYAQIDDLGSFDAWTASPGVHVAFVPGDGARNLETPDVAIILPELRQAFQNAFDCAVIGDAIETPVREDSGVLKTPALIFYHDGLCLGGIAKVRDWDDYMTRIPRFLHAPAQQDH